MRFTSESVMHDIEVALRERKEIEWSNTDRLLLKAQLHIASLHRQLHNKSELTDEEITEIVADKYEKGHGRYIDTDLFFIEFARAILRKAQE